MFIYLLLIVNHALFCEYRSYIYIFFKFINYYAIKKIKQILMDFEKYKKIGFKEKKKLLDNYDDMPT